MQVPHRGLAARKAARRPEQEILRDVMAAADLVAAVRASPGVEEATAFAQVRDVLKNKDVNVLGIEPGGLGWPTKVDGRLAEQPGEVVVDAETTWQRFARRAAPFAGPLLIVLCCAFATRGYLFTSRLTNQQPLVRWPSSRSRTNGSAGSSSSARNCATTGCSSGQRRP